MQLRGVGIDIVDVERFARLMRRRSALRWFTAEEISTVAVGGNFAEQFAVKEAVFKALRLDWRGEAIPWARICVADGVVRLSGAVAVASAAAGVGRIWVASAISGPLATGYCFAEQVAPASGRSAGMVTQEHGFEQEPALAPPVGLEGRQYRYAEPPPVRPTPSNS